MGIGYNGAGTESVLAWPNLFPSSSFHWGHLMPMPISPNPYPPNPVVEVVCSGTPFEMGLAQGSALKTKIHAARDVLAKLEAFRLKQPWWLPFSCYLWLSERRATRFLELPVNRDYPEMKDRLLGIAQGAGVSPGRIHLFNALEPLLSSIGGSTTCPGACSAVAVRGSRSVTGEPMLARNFDYLPLIQPYYVVRESRPNKGFRALEFTTVPLAGAVDGMNEKGLTITYDYAFTTDRPPVPSGPISMAISEALQNCSSVAEAAEWIIRKPRVGGGLLLMADAGGDIASLELSNTRSHLRRPGPGEDALFHTNNFSDESMREVQIPDSALYNDNAPSPLRGRRVHHSSDMRNRRYRELLNNKKIFDKDTLGALMADHGENGIPNDFTPCVHGSYWQTTACLQFFPKSRRIRVAYDLACQAKYQEIGF